MSTSAGEPKLHILVVVGTRPEAIKLVPLILALRESDMFTPVVISTGQHQALVAEVFALAGITADADLWVGGVHSRLNERVATFLRRFEDYVCAAYVDLNGERASRELGLAGRYPIAVLVHGDTSSAFAAASPPST